MSNPALVIAIGSTNMNLHNSVSADSPAGPLPLTLEILAKIIGAFTLIGGLALSLGLALIYLTASFLHLGPVATAIDAMTIGLSTLYCCFRILLLIVATERAPEFNK